MPDLTRAARGRLQDLTTLGGDVAGAPMPAAIAPEAEAAPTGAPEELITQAVDLLEQVSAQPGYETVADIISQLQTLLAGAGEPRGEEELPAEETPAIGEEIA